MPPHHSIMPAGVTLTASGGGGGNNAGQPCICNWTTRCACGCRRCVAAGSDPRTWLTTRTSRSIKAGASMAFKLCSIARL